MRHWTLTCLCVPTTIPAQSLTKRDDNLLPSFVPTIYDPFNVTGYVYSVDLSVIESLQYDHVGRTSATRDGSSRQVALCPQGAVGNADGQPTRTLPTPRMFPPPRSKSCAYTARVLPNSSTMSCWRHCINSLSKIRVVN
jgi:hypothetical protein